MPGLRQFALLLLALAAALSLAAAVESGDGLWLGACALGAIGLVALVAACPLEQIRLSVLDAVMAGSATGALAAELEASAATIVAVAGVAAGIALNRWRPERGVLAAAVGLAALAVDPLGVIVAAPAFAVAAARPGPRGHAGPGVQPGGAGGDPRLRVGLARAVDRRPVRGARQRRRGAGGHHGAGRDGAGGPHGRRPPAREPPPGHHGRPHGPRQPAPSARPPGGRDRRGVGGRRRARAAARRPRRLQGAQRHARPPRRR